GGSRRIEVKGTTSVSQWLTIFVSRNEFRVGLRDPDWYLVVCRLEQPEGIQLLGWCKAVDLAPHAPLDQSAQGQWQVAGLSVSESTLSGGLPPVSKEMPREAQTSLP